MTDSTDKNNKDESNWEFKVEGTKKASSNHEKIANKKIVKALEKLVLPKVIFPHLRTNSHFSKELKTNSEEKSVLFIPSSYARRVPALLIDLFLVTTSIFLLNSSFPVLRVEIIYLLDYFSQQLQFIETFVMMSFIFVGTFSIFFLFIILPYSFFGQTLGKKIMGVNIQEANKELLSNMMSIELFISIIIVCILNTLSFYS